MSSDHCKKYLNNLFAHFLLALSAGAIPALQAAAQQLPTQVPGQSSGPSSASFAGSVATDQATGQTLDLSLDEAMQRGLKNNLGAILSGTQKDSARAQRLTQLQALLPDVEFNAREAVSQVDLAAQGLRIPGFPTIIGPFGYTDLRASLSWSLVDVKSLKTYMAAKHQFKAAELTAQDARDMVVLTVGNSYMLVLADQGRVESYQAQVATSKVSLDQAKANHDAGTAPKLDVLRAQVDYQSLEQQLIVAQNALEKDKLALARVIGLPLEQKFNLTDKAPYAVFDKLDVDATIKQAHANRKDLAAMVEQTKAAEDQRKAATADRLPTVKFDGDYGDIGVNVRKSHGTGDASGTLSVPVFKEFGLRGEVEVAQSQLDTQKAQMSDLNAQVDADVRDALLDIEAAQKQVEVARSSVDLATEALSEAQQRYANGVSDNLAVSQAQQSVAQANDQYVSSLYRDNVAKLSLVRALGAGQDYSKYLGGK
ncbi:TolC family protein [Telmatobacter sp. DSM 110680]|uniref:TolC family protein n=1 Tax=Telmatobacter sp. DSM 110680 TaxID=3036704 RepID=A0AAU7DQ74_9BACT